MNTEGTSKPSIEPISDNPHPGDPAGRQRLYRFDNGYGASVVQARGTYGSESGLSELAVIAWRGGKWDIAYDTPVTEVGWLSEDDVQGYLQKIRDLPAPGGVS